MKKLFVAAVLSIAVLSCSQHDADVGSAGTIDELARDYLLLELSMGLHDPNHVDAYFGPPEIKNAAAAADLGLDEILAASATLDESLARVDTSADTELQQRIRGMRARLQALQTRIALNEGVKLDFDAESLRLFGTEAPRFDASHFDAILAKIDAMLPGSGSLAVRVEALTNAFEIPPDRLAAVFDAAIAECRRRTLLHIELPPGESFTIEYVTDKPWSGYNWYQGDAVSVIQINTDLPTNISRAVDLGCHEGYPGHHTYNALLEKNLVDDKQWLEFSLYPLFSPQSLIAEGSGNYGIDLAFPADERIQFEKSVLFPLAGLDVAQADRYYELLGLRAQLSYAGNEAARGYLNGDLSREQAVAWLVNYSLATEQRAQQRVRFFDAYRSYVINYNHGKDMVAAYIERDGADDATRWARFAALLSSPMLPADLN